MVYLSINKTSQASVLLTYLALIITTKQVAIMTNQKISNSTVEEQEIWKDIEGFDGWYQVSNKGNVRSWKCRGHRGVRAKEPKLLNPSTSRCGYYTVGLHDQNEKMYGRRVSRLVAIEFIYNPENKPEVNHIDGNKKNNNVENLEWATSKENVRHANRNGLMNQSSEAHSELTKKDIIEIRKKYKTGFYTQNDLGSEYDLDQAAISRIINKKSWKRI